jgi:short subunit dehydrogenase-like uncharacterized protein
MSDRDFDLVLWGATGFTGRLVAEYLFGAYGTDSFRWALAGRSMKRLEEVRTMLGAGESLPLLRATLDDLPSLARMARSARVICTTVGPYARYGTDLLAACAREGTHYCDLTGEVQWMRRMIDVYQDEAVRSGARIVHSCGFDSIPSDLGVYFVQRHMRERHGVASPYVRCRVAGFRGGTSGGTAASMLNMLEEAGQDPEVRRVIGHPYALNPKDARSGPDPPDTLRPLWDEAFEQWTGPFMMAGINTRVVRRSNALLGFPYGRGFRYDEAILCGPGRGGFLRAALTGAGLGAVTAAGSVDRLRALLRWGMPSPGKGPSAKQREAGFWHLRFLAEHPSDPETVLRAQVTGDRDPGYGSTSKMLGEAAVCLAQDALESEPGMLTPAAAMGDALIERLQTSAGVTFELE